MLFTTVKNMFSHLTHLENNLLTFLFYNIIQLFSMHIIQYMSRSVE